jgi:hypothetical protein
MTDLNQGASIEAERLIDAVRKLVKAKGRFHTEQNYKALVDSLDAYDAAVKAPPIAAAGEELPPLPEPEIPAYVSEPAMYTAEQVEQIRRDIIDFYERGAERIARKQEEILLQAQDLRRTVADLLAQRKQAALQEIIDIGQEIEAGAAAPTTYTVNGEVMSPLEYIAYLHDQLATKGQGEPVARANYWSTVGSSGWEFKWLGEKPASGMSVDLYLAAPASAQPADPRLEAFIDWYLREGERSEIHPNGHIERTTREHVLAWLDQATGAQPDQRGSAAEGGSKK